MNLLKRCQVIGLLVMGLSVTSVYGIENSTESMNKWFENSIGEYANEDIAEELLRRLTDVENQIQQRGIEQNSDLNELKERLICEADITLETYKNKIRLELIRVKEECMELVEQNSSLAQEQGELDKEAAQSDLQDKVEIIIPELPVQSDNREDISDMDKEEAEGNTSDTDEEGVEEENSDMNEEGVEEGNSDTDEEGIEENSDTDEEGVEEENSDTDEEGVEEENSDTDEEEIEDGILDTDNEITFDENEMTNEMDDLFL